MEDNFLPSAPKYKNARMSLFFVLVISLVNIFTYFLDYYFYFSSRIALVLVAVGSQIDIGLGTSYYKFIFAALAVASLVPYLLSWIFSKKKVGWMIAALVLFSIDTVILLIDVPSIIANGGYTILIDVAAHIFVILELAFGVKAGFSLEKERIEMNKINQMKLNDKKLEDNNDEVKMRNVTITREKAFAGMAVPIVIYINNCEICRLKNGESKTIEAPSSSFELLASLNNGLANTKKIIEEGENNVSLSLKTKIGFSATNIVITQIK